MQKNLGSMSVVIDITERFSKGSRKVTPHPSPRFSLNYSVFHVAEVAPQRAILDPNVY